LLRKLGVGDLPFRSKTTEGLAWTLTDEEA